MLKLLLIVCIPLAMTGCFKTEDQVKQERKEEVVKQFMNQKYDHRSLEQRVREAQAKRNQTVGSSNNSGRI